MKLNFMKDLDFPLLNLSDEAFLGTKVCYWTFRINKHVFIEHFKKMYGSLRGHLSYF